MKKNNFILIGILFLLVVIFIVSKNVKDYRERRVLFFDYRPEILHSIEISAKGDTLRFRKDDYGEWLITYPIEYPASESRMNTLFNHVLSVETSTTSVSDQPGSHDRFGLGDSDRKVINLMDERGNILDKVAIGRTGANTFGKKINNDEIFQLANNIFHQVVIDLNSWRDLRILSLNREFIGNMNISYRNNDYTLNQSDNEWYYSDGEQNFLVPENNTSLRQILNSVSNLRVNNFIDFKFEDYETYFTDPELVVEINTIDNKVYNLQVIVKDFDEFVLMKNMNQDFLYEISNEWLNRFTKSYNHFQE